MAVTPYTPQYNLLQLEILINGENGGLHTMLKKATIHYELNKIPYAKLHFIASNPNTDDEKNPLESDTLAVTQEIEIRIHTGQTPETLFKGILYKVERNASASSGFETKVECKDISVHLTSPQAVVADETFGEKMDRFLSNLNIENEVTLESFGEENVSKMPNTTPWDYIISYLDGLGYMATVREGVFSIHDSTAAATEATYLAKNGVNVFEFEGRQEDTVADVQVQYWNPETQAIETQESSTQVDGSSGTEVVDMSQSNYTSETLSQMASAIAAKNRLAAIKGTVKTYGNIQAKYGQYIAFEKVNEVVDSAPLLISVEHHTIENGSWDTTYNFGLENNQSFAQNIKATTTSSTSRIGQTNTVQGLQIGVVTQIEDDPNNEFRVRVRMPSIATAAEGVWARLASFQAGSERGAFFIPEVDDEVVLGCFNNNPDTPVILGKLYSSAKPMPFPLEADNNIQGIVSKTGTKIIINDEDKAIEISTEKGNKLLISDAEKGFVLEDENQNKLIMNADGITLESSKDIMLKAPSGNINVEGMQNSLKAQTSMKLTGKLIELN